MNTDTDKAIAGPKIDLEAGRRAFLRAAGMGTALAAMAAVTAEGAQAQTATSTDYDVAILNFALNLEYLEAEFYQRAVLGAPLTADITGGRGRRGTVTGGSKVPFSNSVVQNIAVEIATDEKNHVIFLRNALGNQAAAEPTISLDTAFTALAQAAGIPGSFNPYADDVSFLLAAYIFEDVGVTAYNGAAPYITDKTYLAAAASILAVEAYHAGTIRTLLFSQQNGNVTGITGLISNLRASLSQANDDQGIGASESGKGGGFPTPANIVPGNANSMVYARTPRQVLNVVYGGVGASKGVFFPNGINDAGGLPGLIQATGG